MSTLDRADTRRTADSDRPGAAAGGQVEPGAAYLTDEVFLYRVVGFVAGEHGGMVELEDCYGLDVVRVPLSSLRARRLRAVTPRPA